MSWNKCKMSGTSLLNVSGERLMSDPRQSESAGVCVTYFVNVSGDGRVVGYAAQIAHVRRIIRVKIYSNSSRGLKNDWH